ncbi:MAG: 3'-5'-bisphosphate nucleotidase [Gammaproteobacteria bacterium SG8_47]|nr:MAG: 3'-5'-bisphosphate nucleotidase [Gammaproteobacteria bacterium SG8_47]
MTVEAGYFDELLPQIVDLARDAGERILAVYRRGECNVERKPDSTPVTEADLVAHHAIIAGLAMLNADWPVLSEESEEIPYAERRQWQRYWLVDPLDGTREFIKRNGEFSVNIALIDGNAPVLGVVHAPVSGMSYYARRGGGAYKMDPQDRSQPIHVRSYRNGRVVVAGSRSHRGDSLNRFLANLPGYEIITMGSALKSCLVAEGKADIYPRLGPTSEWDTGAAQCVVEEAGGSVTDTSMRPLRYNTKASLLNPHFFVFGDSAVNWSKYM